jgi:hypothetical protein
VIAAIPNPERVKIMARTATAKKPATTVTATPAKLTLATPATATPAKPSLAESARKVRTGLMADAKKMGLVVPAGTSTENLRKMVDATRKTAKPAPEGTPVKSLTPEESARAEKVGTLESLATSYAADGLKAADRLANTMVELFKLSPWTGQKLHNGNPMQAKHYFTRIRGGFNLPTDARRVIVTALASESLEMVGDVAGCGTATVSRDRKALGIIDAAKSDAQNSGTDTDTDTDDNKTAKTTKPVTADTVAGMIASMTDAEELARIVTLATARIAELSAAE